MLLLVLILVLVAFGLLVVALLTGNVLSAWLSVAVSVAAAVVLVIDWLQRRSAVKAGRAGAESAPAPRPQTSHEDLDPVTEVLPVYTPESDEPEDAGEASQPRRRRPADRRHARGTTVRLWLGDHPALRALPLHRADLRHPE